MVIENITVRYCCVGNFENAVNEGVKHVKELPYLSIVQATEGSYSFGLNGCEQKSMNSGECFIAPSLARQEITHHIDKKSGHMSARWVFMDVIINDVIPFDLAFSLPILPERELCDKIGVIFDKMFASTDYIDHKIGCYELLKLLMPFAIEKQGNDFRIDKAVHYIQKHFNEHISIKDIAGVCNMSEPNLYRLFRHFMGTSPMDYCNSLRLSHSYMLLENSSYSIEEIGTLCGIDDPFYFSKVFKAKAGVSPAVYRKNLNK